MKRFISLLMSSILGISCAALPMDAKTQPFSPGTAECDYFRIPSMITLPSGRVIVSADVRYGYGSDSPANIETGVSFSDDSGESWSALQLVNHFTDMEDVSVNKVSKNTASFIDSACVCDEDGTIYLICDACPAFIGSLRAKHNAGGFMDGKLALCDKTTEDDIESTELNRETYPYYVGAFEEGFAPVCRFRDDTVYDNYYVDPDYNLYRKSETMTPVWIAQLDCYGKVSSKRTQANIFYAASPVKVYPTFYAWLRVSRDGGETWENPQILNPQIEAKGFTGICPGRGLFVDGRILFCVYDTNSGTEIASTIYSDDHGQTWHRGSKADKVGKAKKSSESQLICLPDGTLRMYSRNKAGYIGFADSTDGGVTWSSFKLDKSLKYCSDCMVSFLNYSEKIDGKDVIVASYPTTAYRKLGVVRIGLVDERNNVDWKYQYNVTSQLEDTTFNYSCLSELPDGRIAMLYESGWTEIQYKVFTPEELMVHEKQPGAFRLVLMRLWQQICSLFAK